MTLDQFQQIVSGKVQSTVSNTYCDKIGEICTYSDGNYCITYDGNKSQWTVFNSDTMQSVTGDTLDKLI
jgi:hypothetical protein